MSVFGHTRMPSRRNPCPASIAIGSLIAMLTPCLVAAQQVTTGFRSDASRYVWTGGLEVDQPFGPWRLTASNVFRSEAFLLDDRVNELRDENVTQFLLRRSVRSGYQAVFFGEGSWFSQNEASTTEAYAGIRAAPTAAAQIEPAVGFVLDRKPGLLVNGQTEPDVLMDGGIGVSLRGSLAATRIGEVVVEGRTDNRWHFIDPRMGRSMLSEAIARRPLDRGSVTLDLRYANLRRDSYQASSFLNRGASSERPDDTIEATTSDTLDAGVVFEHPLWRRWTIATDTRLTINNRYVRAQRAPPGELFFDTNFNRTVLDLQARVAYEAGGTTAAFSASRSITEERRRLDNAASLPPAQAAQRTSILRLADFDRGLLTLQGNYATSFLGWISVRSSLRGSILRHDTPVSNLDDRDESSFNGDLGLRLHVRQGIDVDLRLYGVEHHTVFLDGTRSGENNRRRSLRFRPGMRWHPSRSTDLRIETEVRAVYTTDDFDLPNEPKNDQSARELKYLGALSQHVGEDAIVLLEATYSKLLLGRLLWEDFREIPFDTLQTTTGYVALRVGSSLVAETGVRVLHRSDFERSLTLRYAVGSGADSRTEIITRPGRERLIQIGPTADVAMPMTNRSELRLSGWVQFQQVRYTLYGELPEEDVVEIRRAADRVERRTIPNLTITLSWNL